MSDSFKEKYGGVEFPLQLNEMSRALRNRLWNTFTAEIYRYWTLKPKHEAGQLRNAQLEKLVADVVDAIGYSVDELPNHFWIQHSRSVHKHLKKIYEALDWVGAYDFVEKVLRACPPGWGEPFKASLNTVLEQEKSGYRVVGSSLVAITDVAEISEVEEALERSGSGARKHIESALSHLGKSPATEGDYRAASHEAIAAVESIVREHTGGNSLGQGLKAVKLNFPTNPAFILAMEKLYGYTNSPDSGVRHCFLDDIQSIDFAEAKYFVVACSAFVNYVLSKAAETQHEKQEALV